MIEEYLASEELRLAIMIIDARHRPSELDIVMNDYLDRFKIACQVVATKIDKVPPGRRHEATAKASETLGGKSVIPYSSATGIGKKELWQLIREV